jgi:hypothetical protein
MNSLSIPEILLIMAHHPDKAAFRIPGIYLKYGLIGAFLLELSLKESIVYENNKLILKNKVKPSDPILEELCEKLESQGKARNIRFWIRKLALNSTRYRWELLGELEKRRVIRIERMKFLGIIPYKKSLLLNKKLQYDLIREARSNVMQQGELNNRQLVILGLVEACKMLRIISSDRAERKIISKRLKTIMKESPIASGVDRTIKQVHAAIAGAVAASGAAAAAAR